MIPTAPEELDLLAGEYVLGTLEAWKAREVEAALPTSPDLRAAVALWEQRLVGLAELAPKEPPPPELQRILGAVHGNQAAMDGFARLNAGTISPTEFFAPDNVEAIFADAASRAQRMIA